VLFAGFLLGAARIAFDAVTLRHYVLLGIFCGISMGTKYTALISWVLLVLVLPSDFRPGAAPVAAIVGKELRNFVCCGYRCLRAVLSKKLVALRLPDLSSSPRIAAIFSSYEATSIRLAGGTTQCPGNRRRLGPRH